LNVPSRSFHPSASIKDRCFQESFKERRFSIAVFFAGNFKSPFLD
jgi:hypothetical protein